MGPPVAPEYVGVGAKLLKEKERERIREEERRKALEQPPEKAAEPVVPAVEPETVEMEEGPPPVPPEEEVTLPPLRPIGTPR